MLPRGQRFALLLADRYPDLPQLMDVLGDRLPAFLKIFQGRNLRIPSKDEMAELALAVRLHEEGKVVGIDKAMAKLRKDHPEIDPTAVQNLSDRIGPSLHAALLDCEKPE